MTLPDSRDALEYILTHVIQDFMHFMHRTGLTGPQIHVLMHIYHVGECQISEIGMLTGSSPAAASQLVDRLVQHGLVERSEDPMNRRMKILHLTEKSLKLIHQGVTTNHFLADLIAALPTEQRETVDTAFGYLAEASRKIRSSHKRKVEHNASIA